MQDFYLGTALGYPADYWRVMLHCIGQHACVGRHLRACEAHAAEHVAVGEGFAQGEVGLQAGQVALRERVATGPAACPVGLLA